MIISILIFLVSIIPSTLIIIKLKQRRKDDDLYQKNCKQAIKKGMLSVIPIIGLSMLFAIIKRILHLTILADANILVMEAINTFVVLAFAEEFVKYSLLKSLLKKGSGSYSWADITAFMVIIGTAFGLVEDIPYAIGASPGVMLVRGFTMGHVGYGFMMGWMYGKGIYEKKKNFRVLALLIPFILHGIYDFSLTPDLLKLNDNFAIIGVSMAVMDIVLLILTIRFFIRSKNIDKYNVQIEEIYS